jgi:hypothetical protein
MIFVLLASFVKFVKFFFVLAKLSLVRQSLDKFGKEVFPDAGDGHERWMHRTDTKRDGGERRTRTFIHIDCMKCSPCRKYPEQYLKDFMSNIRNECVNVPDIPSP